MTRSALLPSLVRTIVPLVVGWLLALPIAPAVLDVLGTSEADASRQLHTAVTATVTAAYYLLARLAEVYVRPRLGWLLGWAAQPTDYAAAADLTPAKDLFGA